MSKDILESSIQKNENKLVFEEGLLDAIGLDSKELDLGNAVHTSEPDLGDLSLEEEGEVKHTQLKLYEQGWVQLVVMGGAVALVTVFLGTFLAQSFGMVKSGVDGEKAELDEKAKKSGAKELGFIDEAENKDAELSRLKAEKAMMNQKYQSEIINLKRQQQQLQQQANALNNKEGKEEGEIEKNNNINIEKSPPPPPVVEVPQPAPAVQPFIEAAQVPDLRAEWQNAQDLWNLQRQFGSFGGSNNNKSPLDTKLANSLKNQESEEEENLAVAEADVQENSSGDRQNKTTKLETSVSVPAKFDATLVAEQQAFMSGKVHSKDKPDETIIASTKILAGTQLRGIVKTPIIFMDGDENAGERSFTIEITQSLDLGSLKIPEGSLLIGEIKTASPVGILFLTGSVIVTPDGEFELPENLVEIRGEGGKPLMANLVQRGKMQEFGKFLGAMVMGGLREAANLYNRPDQKTIVNNNQTIITTQQPTKNYPAAAISGAMSEITPRVQRTLQPAQQPPGNVWQVPAGKPVSIYFRRSLTIETG